MYGKRQTRSRVPPKRFDDASDLKGSSAAAATTTSSQHSATSTTTSRRASPGRTRQPASPARRSSRARSTTLGSSTSTATVTIGSSGAKPPSPIKETKEESASPRVRALTSRVAVVLNKSALGSPLKSSRIAIPTLGATTTTTGAATKTPTPLSPLLANTATTQHSKYNSEETLEMSTSVTNSVGRTEFARMREFVRRSVSKTIDGVVAARGRGGSATPTTTTTTTTERAGSRLSRRSTVSRSIYDEEEDEDDDAYLNDDNAGSGETVLLEQEEGGAATEEELYKSFSATQPLRSSITPSTGQLCRKLASPVELGGRWGVLALMLLVPPLVVHLQLSCSTSNNCRLRWPNVPATALSDVDWSAAGAAVRKYFPLPVVGAYVGFVLAVFVLSAVIGGKQVRLPADRGGYVYCFNGPALAVLATVALALAETVLRLPVAAFVMRHYVRLCIYAFVNAFIVALWAYWRRRQWTAAGGKEAARLLPNDYGRTGSWLIDFAQGRQVNPRWLGLVEFKLVSYRLAYLSALLLAQCCIYVSIRLPAVPAPVLAAGDGDGDTLAALEDFVTSAKRYAALVRYDGGALLAASQLLLYAGDALLFEHHLASSFELQAEGFGCLLLLRHAATPFLLGGVMRRFQQQRLVIASGAASKYDCRCLAAYAVIWSLLFAGLLLKRFSMAVKYQYRRDPHQPAFSGVDSVHTFQGRRLLLGSLWGRLRQPNYAGDIVALCALALPLALPQRFAWPPLIGVLLVIAVLVQRTRRLQRRNLARYHSSWVRYCAQVRSYLLPKVY